MEKINIAVLLTRDNYSLQLKTLLSLKELSKAKVYLLGHFIPEEIKNNIICALNSAQVIWLNAGETMVYEILRYNSKLSICGLTYLLLDNYVNEDMVYYLVSDKKGTGNLRKINLKRRRETNFCEKAAAYLDEDYSASLEKILNTIKE